jgi:Zn-finger nucleic acid-binding protein
MNPVQCPSCGTEMQDDSHRRLLCPNCGMAFFPLDYLEELAGGLSDHIEAAPSLQLCRDCPVCAFAMTKITLLHHDGWLMDFCSRCQGVYLDRREADEMQGFLPDRHTGAYHVNGYDVHYDKFLVTS